MKCERALGGTNVFTDGLCAATTAFTADGFNSGKNGGRICWAVAGSLCSVTQGKFAREIRSKFSALKLILLKRFRNKNLNLFVLNLFFQFYYFSFPEISLKVG